jgi:hypothetical protein
MRTSTGKVRRLTGGRGARAVTVVAGLMRHGGTLTAAPPGG